MFNRRTNGVSPGTPRVDSPPLISPTGQRSFAFDDFVPSPVSPFKTQAHNSILDHMAKIWREDAGPHKARYKAELDRNLQLYGLPFMENLAILGMRATLENAEPSDNNFFLMRLFYVAGHLGLISRTTKGKNGIEVFYRDFPFNPASAFAHGKRVQLDTDRFSEMQQWLMNGLEGKFKSRPSSHALHASEGGFVEKIGLSQVIHRGDRGIHLGIFGNRRLSPYTHEAVQENGDFGHICMVSRQYQDVGTGSFLFGLENSGPGCRDQQGSLHGPLCRPNEWSALFLPKWGDDFFSDHADGALPLPSASTNTLLIRAPQNSRYTPWLLTPDNGKIKDYVLNYLLADDKLNILTPRKDSSPPSRLAWV